MKAVRIRSFGGPEVMHFEDIPIPVPEADEILVRVCAASINPVDYKTREGKYPAVARDALPVTLGRDISGLVAACGPEVRSFRSGDPIFAMLPPDQGGFAEFVRVKAEHAATKPMSLSHIEAAAVPLAALTALQGLFDYGGIAKTQRVLIHGGAGGVGHFAIQLAKIAGATVFATVSADDRAFVRELGADVAIDYHSERFEDIVHDMDLVFDLIGGETQERSWPVLKQGGILVSTLGQPSREKAAQYRVRGIGYQARPNGEELAEIAALIDTHRVKPIVAATFPFAAVSDAEEVQEKTHPRGKIVLEFAA
ncbi:MAG: NADP-dependent oxidoreductase [Beijerinckiaceae bacterium]|nr:MAG: NADP-dependent oxidoreductase [Beijerinckiaceae bacterium]